MTPSTILSARSTSPPKSEWPGVSTILIFTPRIKHGRVLGKNGDAALAFQIVRVHDALGHGLVVAESAALAEHGVNQRGLAVVHVGDDGDIANTRIQIENSSGLQIRAYYYFTMAAKIGGSSGATVGTAALGCPGRAQPGVSFPD